MPYFQNSTHPYLLSLNIEYWVMKRKKYFIKSWRLQIRIYPQTFIEPNVVHFTETTKSGAHSKVYLLK